jgi:hypothetical protein
VEVTHLAYDGTLQTAQLALVSAKLRSSLLLEGHMQTDGLAALEGDDGDTFLQLARRLTEGDHGADDAQGALDALAAEEAAANDDLLDAEVKEQLARVAAQGPIPEVLPSGALDGLGAELGDPDGAPAADTAFETAAAQKPREAAASDAGGPAALQPSRQLTFLELRDELLRRGVTLPQRRGRKAAPEQAPLFGG